MKIGIIADIHHGSPSALADDWKVLDRLSAAIDELAAQGADMLIDLGDRISEHGHDADVDRLRALAGIFARFPGPRVHLLGNHDVVTLDASETAEILGCPVGHRLIDAGAVTVIAWQPDVVLPRGGPFQPAGPHIAWLRDAIAAADKPVLIATHVPVSDQSMIGNYYFEHHPWQAHYPDSAEIRAVIAACRQPVTWISGHQHWNTLRTINGSHHLTVQSFSERFTTGDRPAGAYALLDLPEGDEVSLRVFGNDPFLASLPLTARRWAAPLGA